MKKHAEIWGDLMRSLALALAVVGLVLAVATVQAAWEQRQSQCPSLDILSWDGNLRLIGALDQKLAWRSGQTAEAAALFWRAETWPPLRDVLHHAVALVLPDGLGPSASVWTSVVFFLLLFPTALYALVRILGSLRGLLAFVMFAAFVVFSREFLRYSLTGMLATQGMWFMLCSSYFLFRLYSTNGRNAAGELRTRIALGAALALLGVFFTKYPFGPMLVIALVATELLVYPRAYAEFGLQLWTQHYRGWRSLVVLAFCIAWLVLSRTGELGDLGRYARAYKAGAIAILFYFAVDLYVFLWRTRTWIFAQLPATMRLYVVGIFLPMLIWLFSYPTRLKTVLGTQQRIVESPGLESFSVTLLRDSVELPGLMTALLLAALAVAWMTRLARPAEEQEPESLPRAERVRLAPPVRFRPARALTFFLLVQLVILEFATVNRQERHIYHLLPAIYFCLVLIVFRSREGLGTFARVASWLPGLLVFGLLLAELGPEPLRQLRLRDVPASALCANPPEQFVQPARDTAATIDPTQRYVVFNRFHEITTPMPQRALATPIDLLLRRRTLASTGYVQNDNRYRYKDWRDFSRLLVVGVSCDAVTDQLVAGRAKETEATLRLLAERSVGGLACVREYELSVTPPSGSGGKQ